MNEIYFIVVVFMNSLRSVPSITLRNLLFHLEICFNRKLKLIDKYSLLVLKYCFVRKRATLLFCNPQSQLF